MKESIFVLIALVAVACLVIYVKRPDWYVRLEERVNGIKKNW